jgi:hypothetical protein
MQGVGQNISSIGNQLWSAVEGAPSYDFQFFPKVAAIGAEARSRAENLSSNVINLGERLQLKGYEFETVDNASLDSLGSITGPLDIFLRNTGGEISDFARNYLDLGHLINYTGYTVTAVTPIIGESMGGIFGGVLTAEGAIIKDSREFYGQPDRFVGAAIVDTVIGIGVPLLITTGIVAITGLTGGAAIPIALAVSLSWDALVDPIYETSEVRYTLVDRETAVIDDLAANPYKAIGPLSTVYEVADFIGGPVRAAADCFLP